MPLKKKRIWDFACDTVDKNPPGDTEDVGFIPDKDNYNMIPLVRGIFKKKKKESGCLCSTKMKDMTKRKAENQGTVLDSTVERGTGNTMMPTMQEDSRTVSLDWSRR